ncbi:MAG: zinc ribbon domain-containing protein [Treponema sp.]|nr:zinc ribbon domain-containing protein [Treponema sp.]
MVFCEQCGTQFETGENFCSRCGTKKSVDVDIVEQKQSTAACFQCGTRLDDHEKFCSNCGKPKAAGGAAAVQIPSPNLCGQCKTRLEEEEKFCPGCGKPRDANIAAASANMAPHAPKRAEPFHGIERIIGIDFGTSTSIVKVKSYKNGQPMDAREMSDYVRFDNKTIVPTLVFEGENNRFLTGYEAEIAAENFTVKGVLHQNFKMNLLNPEKKEEALLHTEIFLKYLYESYNSQKNNFPSCDKETTYISYPAKWPDEVRQTMIRLTEKTGFKNVHGVDEPSAAIHAIMTLEGDKFDFSGNNAANVLVIDMGAGTTDLVLCSFSPQREEKIEFINVWPKVTSDVSLGGREIDEVLCDYVKTHLLNCGVPNVANFKEKHLTKCKTWKENNISPTLKEKNGVVRYCGFVEALLSMINIDMEFPPISRDVFEKMFENYITQYCKMIHDCLDDAGFNHGDLDYVILTGGHCQWYFTQEIVLGTLTKFGKVDLPKIKQNPNKVIKISLPQETVAMGMVFQRLSYKNQNQIYHKTAEAQPVRIAAVSAVPAPAVNSQAAPTQGKNDVYILPPGKTIKNTSEAVELFLRRDNDMDTQVLNYGDQITIQARAKGGNWKQFVGLDKVIAVQFIPCGDNMISVNIGESKWTDKAAVAAVSMVVLWPLLVTSGIGMVMQAKLPGEIRNTIINFLAR